MSGCKDCVVCYKKYDKNNVVAIGFNNYNNIQNRTTKTDNIKCKYGTKVKDKTNMPSISKNAFDMISSNLSYSNNSPMQSG